MTQRFSEVPHGAGSLRPGTVTHRPVSLALEAYRSSSASREGNCAELPAFPCQHPWDKGHESVWQMIWSGMPTMDGAVLRRRLRSDRAQLHWHRVASSEGHSVAGTLHETQEVQSCSARAGVIPGRIDSLPGGAGIQFKLHPAIFQSRAVKDAGPHDGEDAGLSFPWAL